MRRGDLVEVKWVDSTECAGWREIADIEQWALGIAGLPCWSTGYLVSRDADGVAIVQSWTTDTDGKRSVADALHIPAVAVVAVKLVRRGVW